MITTIIIFIIVLGFLVFVHELGHFVSAKKSGMKVEEFGFGFPPRLIGLQKTESGWKIVRKNPKDTATIYSINWIPFGAFVKIKGENGEDASSDSFTGRPWMHKLIVLASGVLMNVLAAWLLLGLGLSIYGLPTSLDVGVPDGARIKNSQVGIANIAKNSPAESAGIRAGDIIGALDGQIIQDTKTLQDKVNTKLGQPIEITLQRGKNLRVITLTPDTTPPEGRGPLGVELTQIGTITYPITQVPVMAARLTGFQLQSILQGLSQVLRAGIGLKDVAGPAKIAQITGQVAELGPGYLLQFASFLSLNLAVLNILPFPALDGGRILFLVIEKIRGKRNNQLIEQWANVIGFMVLLGLVAVVTINDIRGFEIVQKLFN